MKSKTEQPEEGNRNCYIGKFRSWKHQVHDYSEVDITQEIKYIGKIPDQFEEGIYKKIITINTKSRCKNCGKEKIDTKRITEIRRQNY